MSAIHVEAILRGMSAPASAAEIAHAAGEPDMPAVYAELVRLEARGRARLVPHCRRELSMPRCLWRAATPRSEEEQQAAFAREFAQWRKAQEAA